MQGFRGCRSAPGAVQAAIIRSTSATRSRRWNGLDSTLASFGAREFGMERHRREAGDEHDLEPGIELGRPPRQLDPVHFRHDDIGQQQIEGCPFQLLESRQAFRKRRYVMAGLDQTP